MKVHTNKTSTISLLEKSSEDGSKMMRGIYEGEKALYDYSPEHIPRPMGWGVYASDANKWFYICEFHDMIDEVPEPKAFVSMISQIHKASMGKSPTGMHGFHVNTHIAILPNDNTWQSSWEVWFAQAMRKMLELEEMAHGTDPQLEILKKGLFDKVIPRLLRPLETGGRSIQPCLIHSDLWPGNIMTDVDTDEIMIFDSCTFWGHNEADLGSWRAPRYKLGRPFFKEYQRAMGLSEPDGDWDDRNALYAMYVCRRFTFSSLRSTLAFTLMPDFSQVLSLIILLNNFPISRSCIFTFLIKPIRSTCLSPLRKGHEVSKHVSLIPASRRT